MIRLNALLRSPVSKSPERGAAAAGVDPASARVALTGATDEEQRRHHAEELGCALAALQKEPLADDPPDVWVAAISHIADKSLALQWIGRLSGDGWLGEVAISGRFAEVRLAAAQRIEDREVLRQLVHLSRGRDKAVFQHCSGLLRQSRQAATRAQRAVQLEADLRELLEHAPMSVSGLIDLQHEMQALAEASETPLAECRLLMDQAEARLRQESESRRALEAGRTDSADLLAQCMAATVSTLAAGQIDGWRDQLAGLVQTHASFPPWLAAKGISQALVVTLREIESRLIALQSEPTQPAPEVVPVAAVAPPVKEQPAARPAIDRASVRALLERMEQALEQGHVAEADAAAKQIKAAAGSALHGSLATRVQRAQARVAELSDWAKWGAQKKREDLIAAAHDLLAGSYDVEHLARVVPALREEWKRLNAQASPMHGEWTRFDTALEKAYRPVAAQRAQEAARRSKARADKEALCTEWEAAVAVVDWERPDYATMDALRQQMLDRWRAIPRAGFREERALRKRFDKTLGKVDQGLAAVRGAEVGRREQLIAAVEALRTAPDLRGAIGETRTLQQQWRDGAGPLRLARPDEQKLWQRFRSACDAVFTRRDAERAEQVAQQEKRAQSRVALLDALAATLASAEANQIKRALSQFRSEWDVGRVRRGQTADPLDQRARALQNQAQRRIDELQRREHRDRLEQMARQAPTAEGVDAEALAAGRKEREQLLIDLEIALDLATPEAFAPARRRRQLERLQVRFRGDRLQQPPAEDLLARLYAVPAIPDAETDARVAAVVRRLTEQDAVAGR